MLMRLLALVFNRFPVRWQRRFMSAAHQRFLVGVAGLGVDARGRVLLARHRFGGPQWRFLGGFIRRGERAEEALKREVREETGLAIEVGPILEAGTGFRWARVELVYAFRVTGGAEALTAEVAEIRWFPSDLLPDVRADQRGLIERHLERAKDWARTIRADDLRRGPP
jgi:8-oxo-dGTP diphosphatase